MKKCNMCGETKSLDDFHKKSSSKDGKQSMCKTCNVSRVKKWQEENSDRFKETWSTYQSGEEYKRIKSLQDKAKKYGLSIDEIESMHKESNGVCKICGRKPDRWLVIDHCHKTLIVRGLLCERCNQGLGLFRDNPDVLQTAIDYLNGSV